MTVIYNLAFFLFALFYLPVFWSKSRQAEDRKKLLRERAGILDSDFLQGTLGKKVLWVHAVSVGEVLAIENFIVQLRQACSQHHIVLTTVTPTGQKIARRLEGERVSVCYFPFDFSTSMKRRFNDLRPDVILLAETEIWPNLITQAARARVPVGILNARLSVKSFRRYRRFLLFFRPLFARLAFVLAQTDDDAARFEKLGVPAERIKVAGNMKYDNFNLGVDAQAAAREVRDELGLIGEPGPFWVAGSTHPGEEEILAEAFHQLRPRHAGLRLIIAPRHIERAAALKKSLEKTGAGVALASTPAAERGSFDILLLDRLGVLKKAYAAADIVFVGGSLVKKGGQNPIEPAAFRRAIVHGPFIFNFHEAYRRLDENGGAVLVSGKQDLLFAMRRLLDNPTERGKLGQNAFETVESLRGATRRYLEWITHFLVPESESVKGRV